MSDPKAFEATPDNFGDLPMQPTGSGVADLEVAYERMRLAEDADAVDTPTGAGAAAAIGTDDAAMQPAGLGDDAMDSAAHPS